MRGTAAAVGLLVAAACAGRPTRAPVSLSELRSRGTVLQRHEYSCGAAALATLFGRLGRPASEPEVLRSIFGDALPQEKAPDGRSRLRALTLGDLESGARAAGFKVVSVQVPARRALPEVLAALGPGIARLRLYNEYPHFVMLDGVKDGWVRVADPGYGSFWMPADRVFDAWEAGERLFLTVSRQPFDAWKAGDGKPVLLRRNPAEKLAPAPDPAPGSLVEGVQRDAAFLGSALR